MSQSSIYTIHINPEYKDFTNTILAISIILIALHLLMSNQKTIGIIGRLFNSTFSDTFAKILVAISFYYLVFKKIVSII